MSYADRHIIETYSDLFEGLSSSGKEALIDTLSKSLKTEKSERDENFFKSFGALASKNQPKSKLCAH